MNSDPTRLGENAAGVWLVEMLQNCVRELPGGRSGVDMNLLVHMCKEEPKNAQVAMQILAQDLEGQLGGKPVSQATGIAQTHRLVLGSLFMSYCVSRGMVDRIPPEMEFILKWHPIVMDCANFVSGDQEHKKPWWKFW